MMRIWSGGRNRGIIPVEPKDICDVACKGNEAIFKDVLIAIQLEYKIRNNNNRAR